MNFFRLIFPCANIFFCTSPALPPISFLMVRPLPRLATHNRGERCVTSLKTAAKETILIPNIVHNTAGTRERIGGLEMNLSGLK